MWSLLKQMYCCCWIHYFRVPGIASLALFCWFLAQRSEQAFHHSHPFAPSITPHQNQKCILLEGHGSNMHHSCHAWQLKILFLCLSAFLPRVGQPNQVNIENICSLWCGSGQPDANSAETSLWTQRDDRENYGFRRKNLCCGTPWEGLSDVL